MKKSLVVSHALLLFMACTQKQPGPLQPTQARALKDDAGPPTAIRPSLGRLGRSEFNQRAQERFSPLFWRSDANHNQVIDPDELVVLVGPHGLGRQDFVEADHFTKLFTETYEVLTHPLDFASLEPGEKKRRALLQLELAQGRATLIESDFSHASPQDRAIVAHLIKAGELIETLYAAQLGTLALKAQLAPDDPLGQAVFFRNQGPWCAAPSTEKDPGCNALASKPKRISGLYPAEIQRDEKFCEKLAKEKNAKRLMEHFTTIVAEEKGFKAVPYHQAYPLLMQAVAAELSQAAAAITTQDEAAFKAYLQAAAKAFTTNDWESANAAWVFMGPTNSKWFLRIAPDEVYFEPCAWKAGFAMQLARINLESLQWQKKLEPVKHDMEKALAALAGPAYQARAVQFKLPDFIDVVLNAGDQRNPSGATVGQSLPNWGKVAQKGGRTVAMVNLYTDADSLESFTQQASSLLCAATMSKVDGDARFSTMGTVLHEAAHNLGPSHEYKVKGQVDDDLFGGPLASTLEELKAQTASMYFTDWLAERGVISKEDAARTNLRDVTWAFGHISRGMYDGGGKPKNYSQLASIQLGTLYKAKVLEWKKSEQAANGTDEGCFEVDLNAWRPAVDALTKQVLTIKAAGLRHEAEALTTEFVDAPGEWADLRQIIAQRWLRAPRATFVYSVTR